MLGFFQYCCYDYFSTAKVPVRDMCRLMEESRE